MAVRAFQILVQQVVAVEIDDDRYDNKPFDWKMFGRSGGEPETLEDHAQALAQHYTQGQTWVDHNGLVCPGYGDLKPRGIKIFAQPISTEILGD